MGIHEGINQDVLGQVTKLLPPGATPLEKAICYAIAMQFARRPQNVKRSLWNAAACSVHLLPWLAWTVGLEEWSNNWPEHIKRAQIRDAIYVAKKRGTIGAITRALNNYGASIAIKEWWQYDPPQEPHTFDVTITVDSSGAAGQNILEAIKRDIDRNKPLRSHYTLTQGVSMRGGLLLAGIMRSVSTTRLKMQSDVQPLNIQGSVLMVGAVRIISATRIKLIVKEN